MRLIVWLLLGSVAGWLLAGLLLAWWRRRTQGQQQDLLRRLWWTCPGCQRYLRRHWRCPDPKGNGRAILVLWLLCPACGFTRPAVGRPPPDYPEDPP